jgi:hypothetical protein
MTTKSPQSNEPSEPLMKRQKFQGLAEKRMKKAIKDIQLIGNLSNRSAYAYTDQEVSKMFRALNKEIKKAKEKFEEKPKTEIFPQFSF